MGGAEFAAGLEVLQETASQGAAAMMCAEGLWWRCHRRLISDACTVHGWDVVHLGPDGRETVHELTPFAVANAGRLTYPPLQPSLG